MAAGTLFDGDVGGPPTLTVGELAARIAQLTAKAFPNELWVEGQIRNLSRSANGHVYFDLAEPTAAGQAPVAQVSVILRAPEKRFVNEELKRAGGAIRMEDGIEVRIRGRLRWYAPRGVLQVQMDRIDPAFTLGRLAADRERILAALVADGLLEANGRRTLPLVPLRVGLVTSRGSAAHADVEHELERSGIGFTVRLVDARTQGPDSPAQLTRALHLLAADGVDVILLVRGGGARTDLAPFDADLLARAVAAMPVPVFTGIGHEVDRSIADEVAHSAHKTPTAAAAAVVARVQDYLDRVEQCWAGARRAALASAGAASARLDRRSERVGRAGTRALDRHQEHLAVVAERTTARAQRALRRADAEVTARADDVVRRARRDLATADRALDALAARVDAHDPQRALARGWTITTTADGRPVRTRADVAAGDELVTRVVDGTVRSTVRTMTSSEDAP